MIRPISIKIESYWLYFSILLFVSCIGSKHRNTSEHIPEYYLTVIKDKKKGVITSEGDVIIPAEQRTIQFLSKDYILINDFVTKAVVDYEGKLVMELERYSDIAKFYNGRSILKKSDRSLYLIDNDFQIIKEINTNGFGGEIVSGFNENGYAVISAPLGANHGAGPTGVVNHLGEKIVDFIYEGIESVEDRYWVTTDKQGNYGVLNIENQVIIPFEYEDISYKGHDMFYVKKQIAQFDSKYPSKDSFADYWMDDEGNPLFSDTNYDWIQTSFNNDIIEVRKGKKYGFINEKGKEVIPPIYDSAINRVSPNGFIWVIKDQLGGFINYDNQEVIPFQFQDDNECPPVSGIFQDGWTYIQEGNNCQIRSQNTYILYENGDKKLVGQFSSARGVLGDVVVLHQDPKKLFLLDKNGKLIDISHFENVETFWERPIGN